MRAILASALGAAMLATTGCYTVDLNPIPDVAAERLLLTARVEIPPESASYTHDVRSAAAGAGNRFRILVGETLTQYADAYLGPVFADGDDLDIGITIQGFDVRGFEAHVDARFVVSQDSRAVFDKRYHGSGTGYFKQTAWGGAFAMKSSMRKTTDEALRSLFERFLADVNVEYTGWVGDDVGARIEDATADSG